MSIEMEFLREDIYLKSHFRQLFHNIFNAYVSIRQHNRSFVSESPSPDSSPVTVFIDGKDYFSALADTIERASHQIIIAGWQISPSIFMKRSNLGVVSQNCPWRLDKLLLKKAADGVQIYILVYWESKKIARMDLGSEDVIKAFKDHENITVCRHPRNRIPSLWSHHEKVVLVDMSIAFVGGIDLAYGRYDTNDHELLDNHPVHPHFSNDCKGQQCINYDYSAGSSTRYSLYPGKDYVNIFLGGKKGKLNEPMYDYDGIVRETHPRMPWHDVACAFTGFMPIIGLLTHFVLRFSLEGNGPMLRSFIDNTSTLFKKLPDLISRQCHIIPNPYSRKATIKLLRSSGYCLSGEIPDSSIHRTYLTYIRQSEHFIYIENQFFISSHGIVNNEIVTVLANRIIQAYRDNEEFHVIVIIPLKPEFHETEESFMILISLNNGTICLGTDSLYKKLENGGVPKSDICKYFMVYGLRTYGHDQHNDSLKQEIIYVHSKVMIVDDRAVIIGSANINDRSMLGNRDSEVAVLIKDIEMIDGRMNGQPFQVGKCAHKLRFNLMKEHLGLLNNYNTSGIKLEDPLNRELIQWMGQEAKNNAEIFERVFGGAIIPSNNVSSKSTLETYKSTRGLANTDKDLAKKELSKIKKNKVVEYPMLFLQDDAKQILQRMGMPYPVLLFNQGFSAIFSPIKYHAHS